MILQTSKSKLQTAFAALCLLFAVIRPLAFAGDSWLVDGQTVQSLEVQTTNDDPVALHTDGSRKMNAPLVFEDSVSSPTTGLFKAYVPWDGLYDFFMFDDAGEVLWLSTSPNVSFGVGTLAINSSQVISLQYGTALSFEEHTMSGGWQLDSVLDDPQALLNRSYADNRYHQKSAITTPLKFDASLSSSVNGLFKATVPWDAEYDFFTFDPTYEAVVLSPTVSSLGFEAGNLIMHGYGNLRLKGESTYISFEERMLAGGGWFVSTVENDPYAILNRTYADNRYVQQSTGITTNYTVQAGDVLQIQNGVITAINP